MTDHPDSEAIAAIRTGDIDRYGELVRRYERQVYGIAWARLGDAALAEEVVQDSFIRAFRLLGWLRDPSRFAGWITRIARAVAVNHGIRHRRELQRRERWELDPAVGRTTAQEKTEDDSPAVSEDVVRAALGDLPARHRESLVLFYLEGRSTAEAAAALGITEAAFRVRLHRARLALRGRLEVQLGKSLGNLAPRRSVVPGVMSAIVGKGLLADPTGTGAGWLAVGTAGFLKLLPMPMLMLLMPVLALAVGTGVRVWAVRAERDNYRDPQGPWRRLYDEDEKRTSKRSAAWLLAVCLTLGIVVALQSLAPAGFQLLAVLLIGFLVVILPASYRGFRLNPRRGDAVRWLAVALFMAEMGLSLVMHLPGWVHAGAQVVFFASMAFWPTARSVRFDGNLFLRERLGMLPDPGAALDAPPAGSRRALWRFARFCAESGLVTDYRVRGEGLRLRMSAIAPGPWEWLGAWSAGSTLELVPDGLPTARLSAAEAAHLDRLGVSSGGAGDAAERVQRSVLAALRAHQAGSTAEALRLLGHTPDGEIFRVPPERTGHPLAQRWAGGLGLALAGFMMAAPFLGGSASRQQRQRTWHLQPLTQSLEEAKAQFAALGAPRAKESRHRWDGVRSALSSPLVLPPADWATPEILAFARGEWAPAAGASGTDKRDPSIRFLESWPAQKGLVHGWLDAGFVSQLRADRDRVKAELAGWSERRRVEALGIATIPVAGRSSTVLKVEGLRWRVAAFRELGWMDLLDREALARELAQQQVRKGRPIPEGRNESLDPTAWEGLFAVRGWEPIVETHLALAALEELGGVDRVDREACIRGILRYHEGRGLFLAPAADRSFTWRRSGTEPRRAPIISGDAKTTYAAWESLRILGGLERVPDLAAWEWRVHGSAAGPEGRELGSVTWARIEAVLLRETVRGRGLRSPTGEGVGEHP